MNEEFTLKDELLLTPKLDDQSPFDTSSFGVRFFDEFVPEKTNIGYIFFACINKLYKFCIIKKFGSQG